MSEDAGAPLGPTVALAVTLGAAAFGLIAAVAVLAVDPTPLPGLPFAQRQDTETALYLLSFAVLLPLAVILGPRIADTVAERAGGTALSVLAATLVGGLCLAVIIARLLPGDGLPVLFTLGAWWVAAAAALVRAGREPAWGALIRAEPLIGWAWALAGGLVLGSLLAFTPLDSISPVALALGALAVGACLLAYRAGVVERVPRPGRSWRVAIDLAVIALLAIVIPDLVILRPDEVGSDPFAGFEASVIRFHQNFLVGPANQILAGDAMLVDTASQYGVAPIYLLSAWYQVAPIGYGTTGLFDGLLYVLVFAAGYGLLRVAGASRPLAIGALALAVVILIYNLLYPVGGLLQHGMLRFGLPMAVVLAAAAAARWPARRQALTIVALGAVGLSAIWAFETFAFTAFTFVAVAAFDAWTGPGSQRLRRFGRQLALAVAACVVAHLALAGATLAAAGELPDWGRYAAYLDALVFGELADITYDYSRWSAGLLVGLAYAASAAGVVLVAARDRALVGRERATFTALAGLAAYGIALYTYFVNRSADDILPYVSLPALLAATLWLSLLLRGSLGESHRARLAGLAFALTLALVLFSVASSSIGERFSRSPLAYLAPGGDSLADATGRLWDPPPVEARAPAGEALLDRYMPDQSRVAMVVAADTGVEILIRSKRAHSLPFSHPTEDFFAGFPSHSEIDRAVAGLAPGDRMLLDDRALEVLAALRADPGHNVLVDPVTLDGSNPTTIRLALTPQQQLLLQRVVEEFRLRALAADEGFSVVSLEARR